jgi:23S rRNA pseudouridine2605 synthase
MRLAKYLARAGVSSRRGAERLVIEGRVTVAGVAVDDPALDVDQDSDVAVDGQAVRGGVEPVVYALNKPGGVVSTARDTHGRPTVVGQVPEDRRLYPVGRLDVDASGLILLTNDGDLAHLLTHPRHEVPRTYRVQVARPPVSAQALRALRAGVELEDGLTAPARVRRLGPAALELTIHEGRNRQVKRMCAAVGHPVRALERVRFGPLGLEGLRAGQYRRLDDVEVARLRAAARVR